MGGDFRKGRNWGLGRAGRGRCSGGEKGERPGPGGLPGRGRRKGGAGEEDDGGGVWGFCGILRGKGDAGKGWWFLSGGLGVGLSLRRKPESSAACGFRLAPE